jgi:cytochrome o ubiquinol oxidase subunit 2
MRGPALASTFVITLAGCHGGVLDPQGPIASQELTILVNSLGIMLAIVIPTILATLGVAWWFRASNHRALHLPDWEYSGRIELVVWSIPAMTVLLLGGIGWVGSHDLDPPRPLPATTNPVEIQVVSLDWKWLFIYPDLGVASVNHLVVPAGTPITFEITSDGVMNSFFVPQLGSQIYAMAGMVTKLQLVADKPGQYQGLSAQFSGDGFSDMHFTVDAVSPDDFTRWVTTNRGKGSALDLKSFAALAQPSENVTPSTYGTVSQDIFAQIVHPSMSAGHSAHPGEN